MNSQVSLVGPYYMKCGMIRGIDANSSPLSLGLQLYTPLLTEVLMLVQSPAPLTGTGNSSVLLTLTHSLVWWAHRPSAAAMGVGDPTAPSEPNPSHLPTTHSHGLP